MLGHRTAAAAGALATLVALATSATAATCDLTVDRVTIDTGDFTRTGIAYNGATPGPVLRFEEGEEVTSNVTNKLDESTSVHWHGLLLPFEQDGVPGISYPGIAPREGMAAAVPELRQAPLLTMADMGMAHEGMAGMEHGVATDGAHTMPDGTVMEGMDQGAMAAGAHTMPDGTVMEGMGDGAMAGMDHSNMAGMAGGDPFYASGSEIAPTAADGGRFLSYADLKAQAPLFPDREPTREIELRLTGNMERYIWSIDGVKYADAEPIRLRYGERVRFKFVNETMMSHPMHLHGMWSILDNGNGRRSWNSRGTGPWPTCRPGLTRRCMSC